VQKHTCVKLPLGFSGFFSSVVRSIHMRGAWSLQYEHCWPRRSSRVRPEFRPPQCDLQQFANKGRSIPSLASCLFQFLVQPRHGCNFQAACAARSPACTRPYLNPNRCTTRSTMVVQAVPFRTRAVFSGTYDDESCGHVVLLPFGAGRRTVSGRRKAHITRRVE
jgi:hypothetical protein